MKVCIRKSTGRLIEAQSGDADLAVMVQNAVNAGFDPSDIEAKSVTSVEYKTLLAAVAPAPIDFFDVDNVEKALKAFGLVVAAGNGKTPAQLKAAFKTAWGSLP
mgnify:CR=1 FL=1